MPTDSAGPSVPPMTYADIRHKREMRDALEEIEDLHGTIKALNKRVMEVQKMRDDLEFFNAGLKATVADCESEIRRHHIDFGRIRFVITAREDDDTSDPKTQLKGLLRDIRNIVG